MKSSNRKTSASKNNSRPTHWGEVADWYDRLVGDDGSEFHQKVVLPGTLRLLDVSTQKKSDQQPAKKIVDVACGQGVLCRELHEHGVNVLGLDAAVPLIRAAKERGPAEIKYEVADARELFFLPENHFDAAACVLAIQNIHPIAALMAGVARALKPGGKFVIVMMHPCFRGPKETAWGWDEIDRVQYRRVDRYLIPRKSPIVAHPGAAPDVYTWSFHKPLEHYVKAMRSAGLLIDAIEEWPSHKTSDSGPRAAAENLARKEIPMFLAIRSLKIDLPPI